MCTGGAGFDVVFDKGLDTWPCILTTHKLKCVILSEVACKGMIVLMTEYMESKVVNIWYVDATI